MVDGFEFMRDIKPLHTLNNHIITVQAGLSLSGDISTKIYKFLLECGYNNGILRKRKRIRNYQTELYDEYGRFATIYHKKCIISKSIPAKKGMVLILRGKYVKYKEYDEDEVEKYKNHELNFEIITLQELIKIINEHNIKKWKDTKN